MPVYQAYVDSGSNVYAGEQDVFVGFHGQVIEVYDPNRKAFGVPGTWGRDVGDRGLFWIGEDAMAAMGSEYWVLEASSVRVPK
jgi:hypothetical protein